jgi:Ca-activated chloride channel family protein
MRRLAGAAVGLAMWLAGTLAGQQVKIEPRPKAAPKQEAPGRVPNIRVDTTLILVPVTVNDPLNRPVSGLERENFRVFEDKVPQPITQFAMDDDPVAVCLVFDTSGSMGEKLQRSRAAAMEFFRIANPEDEFCLVEFDNSPRLRVPLTSDTGTIENELIFSKSKGSTALLDAVYLALHEMKRSKKNKKALLIISDGGDNHSRYSQKEVTNVVRESDVLIYSIGVFGGGTTPEEYGGAGLLGKISEQTGGRLFEANAVELPDIAKKIGIELRNRYILGYSPQNQVRDGKYHRITVQVVAPRGLPKLSAHWRLGYNAPIE